MDKLDVRDVLLVAVAVYLGVMGMVRLMLAQRQVAARKIAREVEEMKGAGDGG